MYEIWPNARSENKREKSKRSIFSLIRRFSERKSPFSLSLSHFLPLQHVYTHGWSWAASQAALRSFSLLGSFRVRSCWLSFDAIQKKKLMPEHTHTQHTQKETKKRWTLSYLFRRRNTQTAAAVYARAGSQRREEEIAWLGLAWPFTDFSLLLLELLFFFTFASPWYRKEIEKPLKKDELSGHKSETKKEKKWNIKWGTNLTMTTSSPCLLFFPLLILRASFHERM